MASNTHIGLVNRNVKALVGWFLEIYRSFSLPSSGYSLPMKKIPKKHGIDGGGRFVLSESPESLGGPEEGVEDNLQEGRDPPRRNFSHSIPCLFQAILRIVQHGGGGRCGGDLRHG